MQTKSDGKKLIPAIREIIRTKGYSLSTEKVYLHWILRYIKYFRRHPRDMDERNIMEFLSFLANHMHVSSSTQNQAMHALVFLYKQVLDIDIGDFSNHARAKKPELTPVVLSKQEVLRILQCMKGTPQLMAALIYGCGLRLKECLRLRVKDIDFERNQVNVRQAKGKKDRVVPLPQQIKQRLFMHLKKVKELHNKDLHQGFGNVFLPNALEKKYPNAPYEWKWQYVFPAHRRSIDPRTEIVRRHHLHDSVLIRHIKKAADSASVNKKLTTHCFRHSYATHLLEKNYDIRTVQELLGHKDVRTTMRYVHVMDKGGNGTESPLDGLELEGVAGPGDCHVVRSTTSAPRNDDNIIQAAASAPLSDRRGIRIDLWGWSPGLVRLLRGDCHVVRSATSAPRNDGL